MFASMLIPVSVAYADSATLSDPTATPTPSSATEPAALTNLGPQSTTGSGSSSLDGGSLQSAGISPLQSTTSDATGITAPSNLLQAPSTSDASLKVLAGEADGAPQNLVVTDAPTWPWALAAIGLFCIFGLIILYRDRRKYAQNHL